MVQMNHLAVSNALEVGGLVRPCTQAMYRQKAREAEWRQDRFGPATRKGSGN